MKYVRTISKMQFKKRETSCDKPTIFEKRCFYLFQQIQYIVFFVFI